MDIQPIKISHFSDVLCTWAYVAQIRLDEVEKNFGPQIKIDHHFFPVFGDPKDKIKQRLTAVKLLQDLAKINMPLNLIV